MKKCIYYEIVHTQPFSPLTNRFPKLKDFRLSTWWICAIGRGVPHTSSAKHILWDFEPDIITVPPRSMRIELDCADACFSIPEEAEVPDGWRVRNSVSVEAVLIVGDSFRVRESNLDSSLLLPDRIILSRHKQLYTRKSDYRTTQLV